MMQAKDWWLIIKDTGREFFEDKPFIYSSSIAYFAIFSLPAMAMITVMVAGYFYEDDSVRREMLAQITQLAGQGSAGEVERLMDKASEVNGDTLTKLISFGTLLFSATTVFVTMQNSINTIWRIKPKPERGLVKFVFNRLLSLAMIGSLGFLVVVSLVADTLISLFKDFINEYLSSLAFLLIWLINTGISAAIITVVFIMIYKILPDAKIKLKYVWRGALLTTILFFAGKYLIGFYLGNNDLTASYGAAGSLVALLVWVYYSVLIVLLGAEFTAVYTRRVGGVIRPSDQAVVITIEEVEKEGVPGGKDHAEGETR